MQNTIQFIALIAAYRLQNKSNYAYAWEVRDERMAACETRQETVAVLDEYSARSHGISTSNGRLNAMRDFICTANGLPVEQGELIEKNIRRIAEAAIRKAVIEGNLEAAEKSGEDFDMQSALTEADNEVAFADGFISAFDWVSLPVDVTTPLCEDADAASDYESALGVVARAFRNS